MDKFSTSVPFVRMAEGGYSNHGNDNGSATNTLASPPKEDLSTPPTSGSSGTNVLINGRTAVHAGSQGVLTTVDVCLTKVGSSTVPISYTNVARSADAAKTASTVFINGHPVCHQKSIFAVSTGDEPGNRKGIRSGTIKGKAEFVTGSPNVLIEGIPAVRQGDLMVSNNCNTAPMPLSQPGAPRAREVETEQVEELDETELPNEVPLEASGGKLHIQNELAVIAAAEHQVDPDDLAGAEPGSNHATASLNNQDEIYHLNLTMKKPIAAIHDETLEQKDFREIVLGAKQEDDKQDLWLKLLDLDRALPAKQGQKNWLNLYLGRSKTFEKGKSPQQHNVIVPLIPRCYATPDRDPARAVEVPEGWLYIIRQFESPQGPAVELWRELKSDGLGNFSDVNLNRFKGKDQRKATGQPGFRIIVPYCIDKQEHDLWIAYSEVQWSWARVQSMKKDADLRDQRMHRLDVSDCLNGFKNRNFECVTDNLKASVEKRNLLSDIANPILDAAKPIIDKVAFTMDRSKPDSRLAIETTKGGQKSIQPNNPALLYNLESAPDPASKDLAENLKEAIPVVYLDNPIGIGRRLAGEYQQQWVDLTDCLTELRAMPEKIKILEEWYGTITPGSPAAGFVERTLGPERFFEAAALANRYFFSKISKVIPPGVTNKDAYQTRLAEIEEQFLKFQGKLDKPAIEQALMVSQRSEIRKKLVQAREKLVDFLEKELAAIKSKDSGKSPEDPPLVHALDDYFTLTPLGGRERKQNPTDAIGEKSTPRWRDNYLDGWQAVYDIVAALGKHEYSLDADLEANPPDGWQWRRDNRAFDLLLKLADPQGGYPLHSRLFPKAAAEDPLSIDATPVPTNASRLKTQHLANFKLLKRRDSDVTTGILKFGKNFNELMAMRDDKSPAYEQRLERARHSVLRLVESVLGLQLKKAEVSLEELIARQKQPTEVDNNGGTSLGEWIVKSASFMDKSISTAGEIPKTAEAASGPLAGIRTKVITAANSTRTMQLLRDLGDEKAVTSGLAGFLGLVEVYNFAQALRTYAENKNDDRKWELFAPLATGFLQLPNTTKDIKDAAAALKQESGQAAVQSSYARKGATAKTINVGIGAGLIKTANIIGNLIDMGVTFSCFIENLAQNDDAAIADVISLTGAVLGLVATGLSIPVLGWVAGLIGLAAWLAKAYLFTEDTPVEIWLANGPFVRGEEYHEVFRYQRSTTIKQVKDAKGNWVDTACTVHCYNNESLYIDATGTLVAVHKPSGHRGSYPLFKYNKNGQIYLKAGKHLKAEQNILIGTIGQPFTMHPLLQPTVKEKPKVKPAAFNYNKVHDVRSCHQGMGTFKQTPAEKWQARPRAAYMALADAIYRPRVTLTETTNMMGHRWSTVALKVDLPFFIPEKSELYIDFEVKGDNSEKVFLNPASNVTLNGPGDYEMIRTVYPGESRTFTAKVRLDLYGDGKVQLPHEPLFCGSDIETSKEQKTVKGVQPQTETKWIVIKKRVSQPPITHFDMILNPGDSGTRLPHTQA